MRNWCKPHIDSDTAHPSPAQLNIAPLQYSTLQPRHLSKPHINGELKTLNPSLTYMIWWSRLRYIYIWYSQNRINVPTHIICVNSNCFEWEISRLFMVFEFPRVRSCLCVHMYIYICLYMCVSKTLLCLLIGEVCAKYSMCCARKFNWCSYLVKYKLVVLDNFVIDSMWMHVDWVVRHVFEVDIYEFAYR